MVEKLPTFSFTYMKIQHKRGGHILCQNFRKIYTNFLVRLLNTKFFYKQTRICGTGKSILGGIHMWLYCFHNSFNYSLYFFWKQFNWTDYSSSIYSFHLYSCYTYSHVNNLFSIFAFQWKLLHRIANNNIFPMFIWIPLSKKSLA